VTRAGRLRSGEGHPGRRTGRTSQFFQLRALPVRERMPARTANPLRGGARRAAVAMISGETQAAVLREALRRCYVELPEPTWTAVTVRVGTGLLQVWDVLAR
jgi:hypothetical protein